MDEHAWSDAAANHSPHRLAAGPDQLDLGRLHHHLPGAGRSRREHSPAPDRALSGSHAESPVATVGL